MGTKPGLIKDVNYEDIVKLCINRPKLKVLTWDASEKYLRYQLEKARDSLKQKPEFQEHLARIESCRFYVYGFRAVKGLEFEEVAIVDFFNYEKDKIDAYHKEQGENITVEDEMTPEYQKVWKFYFETFTYKDKEKKGIKCGNAPAEPPSLKNNAPKPFNLEIQLKLLYTGLRKSCIFILIFTMYSIHISNVV